MLAENKGYAARAIFVGRGEYEVFNWDRTITLCQLGKNAMTIRLIR